MPKKNKLTIVFSVLWVIAIAIGVTIAITTVYNMTHIVATAKWLNFWKFYLLSFFLLSIPVTGLFIIGGFVDLMKLFKQLKKERIDDEDDGFVKEAPKRTQSQNDE